MKIRNLLLGLVALSVLSACKPTVSSEEQSSEPIVSTTSEEVTSEEPVTTEDPVTSEDPVTTEDPVTSEWTEPTPVRRPKAEDFNFRPLPAYSGNYYDSIDFNLRGQDLKDALFAQWDANFVGITYSQTYAAVVKMDRDPANPNNILSLYDLKSQWAGSYNGGRWNREHTFPQSKLADGVENLKAKNNLANISSDIANLFACDSDLNTERSNNSYSEWNYETDPELYYQYTTTNTAGEKVDSILRRGYFSPTHLVRGEVARAQLYMLLFYPDNCSISENFTIHTMIKWDREYAPTIERDGQRQDGIVEYQNVRNPFIDNRNLSCYIWGDSTPAARQLCEGIY